MSNSRLYPVPESPPDEGTFIIIGFNPEWLPIVLGLLETIKSPTVWESPPDDISEQVDELMQLFMTDLD